MIKSEFKNRINNIEELFRNILRIIFSFLVGFSLSKSGVSDGFSPFSISFLALTPTTGLSFISVYFGIFFGYITNDFSAFNFKYICANSILAALILISGRNNYVKNIYSPVLPGVVCFVTANVFMIIEFAILVL